MVKSSIEDSKFKASLVGHQHDVSEVETKRSIWLTFQKCEKRVLFSRKYLACCVDKFAV